MNRTIELPQGTLFVKGHYHTDECRRDASTFSNPSNIEFVVPFNVCTVRRWRSVCCAQKLLHILSSQLNPRGVFMETIIVFMFHQWFMTKIDQVVKVQCFYMEADKTVTVPLAVR